MATLNRKMAPGRPKLSDQAPGTDSTIADFIVAQIKAGVDPVNAAGAVGVFPAEFQAWMREGTLTFARVNNGADWSRSLTPDQQDAAWFSDAVNRAHSAHISTLSIVAEQMARGTLPAKTTTRTKTVNGQVVETQTTTEQLQADADMVKWKLTKLEPTIYGDKATLSVRADLSMPNHFKPSARPGMRCAA